MCTYAYKQEYVHMYTCANTGREAHMHLYIYIYACMCALAHVYIYIKHVRMCAHMQLYTHTLDYIHKLYVDASHSQAPLEKSRKLRRGRRRRHPWGIPQGRL